MSVADISFELNGFIRNLDFVYKHFENQELQNGANPTFSNK